MDATEQETTNAEQGTMNDAVAATLRGELAARRVQRKDLAEAAGIPGRTLARYLDGEREISINTLAKIARALDLTPAEVWVRAAERLGS